VKNAGERFRVHREPYMIAGELHWFDTRFRGVWLAMITA
jgi:hypothetical protein